MREWDEKAKELNVNYPKLEKYKVLAMEHLQNFLIR
jgi:hypothetical protein